MPVVTRTRVIPAPPEDVWRVICDPSSLPRWWPSLLRVEDLTSEAWTMVLTSEKGKPVRADWSLADVEPLTRVEWRQELAATPFERFFSRSEVSIRLVGLDGDTKVSITATERLRGLARLGAVMVRRASRKRLDGALAGLERIFERA